MRRYAVLAATAILALTTQAHAYGTWSAPERLELGYSPHHPWDREFTRRRHIAHHGQPQARHRVARQSHSRGAGNLVARSGATASVSAHALPHFQCLVDKLEAAGYKIAFMGGFARRSNPSAHPTGNAVDINQTAFGRVIRRFPGNIEEMCQACGVYSGVHFGDYGHFEMPGKYGYVNVGRRYASARRWRHRHYARAW